MKGILKRFSIVMIIMLMAVTTVVPITQLTNPLVVEASTRNTTAGKNSQEAYQSLLKALYSGSYTSLSTGRTYEMSANNYKTSGGGYTYYTDIWSSDATIASMKFGAPLDESLFDGDKFKKLTNSGKKQFLTDVLTIAYAMEADTDLGMLGSENAGVTAETVNAFTNQIQDTAGMGTTMLTSILKNTKPDYTTANRLYEPFSGVVGTILGVLSIVIMALLGISMALDIAYLTIPAFNMMCTGNETGQGADGKNSRGSTLGGLISKEAKKAYKAADGGEGGQGQGGAGDYKASVGVYLKYRWTGLLLLGICLLYLVQGQIYTLVAWIIDLASGFLDF